MEKWNDIIGYEGFYSISTYGNVKSIRRTARIANNNTRSVRECILRSHIRGQYHTVCLRKNGSIKRFSVHRLQAIAFIDNPENKPCVNHKDGNKLNNNIDNLEWVTYSENVIHAFNNGLHPLYAKTNEWSNAIQTLRLYKSRLPQRYLRQIAIKEGIRYSKIFNALRGEVRDIEFLNMVTNAMAQYQNKVV